MSEKRERCGGKVSEPKVWHQNFGYHQLDSHGGCKTFCIPCPGCFDCAPEKWCEHDLEVCIGAGVYHISWAASCNKDSYHPHHTDGTFCVPAKQPGLLERVLLDEAEQRGEEIDKEQPKCPVHGEGVCKGCYKPSYGGWGICKHHKNDGHCKAELHFLCGCPQEQAKLGDPASKTMRCPHGALFPEGCPPCIRAKAARGETLAETEAELLRSWRPQEQGSGDAANGQSSRGEVAQGDGRLLKAGSDPTPVKAAATPDPSFNALAMEAAKEIDAYLAERVGYGEGYVQEIVDNFSFIISRAISAAVKERDERIAELEEALEFALDEANLLAFKTDSENLEMAALRIARRAAQALRKP